jgi:hypothetical protein
LKLFAGIGIGADVSNSNRVSESGGQGKKRVISNPAPIGSMENFCMAREIRHLGSHIYTGSSHLKENASIFHACRSKYWEIYLSKL